MIRFISFRKIANLLQLLVSYTLSTVSHRVIVWGKPSAFSIEPTNFCNLDCIECPTNKVNTPKGFIQKELARKIIQDLAPTAFHVSMFFQGEPFMNEHINELVSYSSQLNIACTLSTNGHYITREKALKIIDAGLWRLIISIDGYDQESYSQYRSGGNFDTVMQSIHLFAQCKKDRNAKYPIIEAQCLLLSTTENHLKEIKKLCTEAGADRVRFKTAQFYDFENGNKLMPIHGKSRYIVNKQGKYRIKSRLPNRCWRLWHTMVISWQGSVLPCCFDKDWKYSIDTIGLNSVIEIWKHPKFTQMRKAVLSHRAKIDICKNCSSGLQL